MLVERLEKLADYLDTVDPAKFDILQWKSDENDCKCAGGFAVEVFEELNWDITKIRYKEDTNSYAPLYDNERGMMAITNFFGLQFDEAMEIFHVNGYWNLTKPVAPKDVVLKIREKVKEFLLNSQEK